MTPAIRSNLLGIEPDIEASAEVRDPAHVDEFEGADAIEVIERTIRAIIQHLEVSDRRNADALRQLQSQMHEIAARTDIGPAGEGGEDARGAIARIEDRIDALADRFEAIQSEIQYPDAALIEQRLAALAAKIQELTRPQEAGPLTDDTYPEDALQTGQAPERLSERFADLAHSLQSSMSEPSPPAELAELRELVGELSNKVDALEARDPAPGDPGFTQHIAELTRRIEATEARFSELDSPTPPLAELTGRIDAVEQSLHSVATARYDTSKALERQFAALLEQLEASRQAMTDAARFAAAEAASDAVSEAVGEAARQAAQEAIRNAQDAAVQAAREAARGYLETAATAEPGAESAGDARVVEILQGSLLDLRNDFDASDRKIATAFEAVQTTLRDIAERLSSVEGRRRDGAMARDTGPVAQRVEPRFEPPAAAAASGEGEAARIEQPRLPDDLAKLRLPPLGKPPADAAEAHASEEALGNAEDAAEETLQVDETDETSEESNLPREPGSGPPSSILSDLSVQARPREERYAAPAGTDAVTTRSEDALAAATPAAAAPPGGVATGDVTASLRGARTTNELLAAARRAAEAAAQQGKTNPLGRLSLKYRLRIPLSRHGRGEVDSNKDAERDSAALPERKQPAGMALGRPAARKPIVLAVVAVMLLAGSIEIYNLLKKRSDDMLPLPAESSQNEPAAVDETAPDAGDSALPEAPPSNDPPSPGAPIDGGALDLPDLPQHAVLDELSTGTLVSVGESAMPKSEEVAAEQAESPPAAETRSAALTIPTARERAPAPLVADVDDPPELSEKIGSAALRQAAIGGNPIAQFEVASWLAEGRGMKADPAAAAVWYRRAAAGGLAPAQYRLGSLYEKGTGVAQDRDAARIWYERAAARGNRKAMHNLAVLYADGIDGPPNFEAAARWFRAAAELDLADSQYNLGILYARGLGVPQNFSESYKWFSILAGRGDKDAGLRRDAVSGKLDAQALAATKLAAQTWKAQRMDPEANAVRLPNDGWAVELQEAPSADPGADIVRNAQKLLTDLGYEPGPVDGQWGPNTKRAIESFQRDAGLEPTGALTPALLRMLQQSSS
ncbi:MAG: peptidoglycan-binding protein [Hyphomicrobiales bacterium]|nr:peptidoglycan-binding protein [Hyphomicrobiales bacterium]